MKNKVFIILILLLAFSLKGIEKKDPMKALTLSLIFPGAGEIYNKKYIKAGIFISTDLYFISQLIYHNNKVNDYDQKIKDMDALDYYTNKKQYDMYYEKRNNDIWWLGIISVLSIMDSYIDANLSDFDEKKKKLEMKFENKKVSLTYKFGL